MRRATAITLVLMGGGLALGLATHRHSGAECREARARNLPDADRLCASGGSHGGGAGGFGSSSGSRSFASERGGFGSTAAHASVGG